MFLYWDRNTCEGSSGCMNRVRTFGVREFIFVNISRLGLSSAWVYFDAYNLNQSCSHSGHGIKWAMLFQWAVVEMELQVSLIVHHINRILHFLSWLLYILEF